MKKTILAIILTLAIIYVVPFFVYGLFSAVTGLEPPDEGSLWQFLLGVFVTKLGTAIGFVLIFHAARGAFTGKWLLYALLWWLMFAVGEIGQAIVPGYTWTEAVAGVISEAVYFPTAAFVVNCLVGLRRYEQPTDTKTTG